MKAKIARLIAIVAVLFAVISNSVVEAAYSTGLTVEYENEEHDDSEMGTVNINFMVDSIYSYKDSIQVCFHNVNTDEYYTISAENFREDVVQVEIPEGTWEYYTVRFENEPVYNVLAYLSEDTFTVTAGKSIEIDIWVEDHPTTTQLMYVDLVISNVDDFDGTVQMWIEGYSDAYYLDEEGLTSSTNSYQHIKETYTLRFDSNVGYTTKIDAGTWTVTQVYAYDSDGNPMDIAYIKEFTVSRYNDNPQITCKIYTAGELDETTVGLKYDVQNAANTPDFSYNYYYREVETYKSVLGLPEEDIFEEINDITEEEWAEEEQEVAEYQEERQKRDDEETQQSQSGEEVENPNENGNNDGSIVMLVIAIWVGAIAIGIWIGYRWWKRYKKKQEEEKISLPPHNEADYNPYLRDNNSD